MLCKDFLSKHSLEKSLEGVGNGTDIHHAATYKRADFVYRKKRGRTALPDPQRYINCYRFYAFSSPSRITPSL